MKREHVPWLLAGLTLLLHAIGNPHYGFFRDELYFIICGRHPAWGYVDQPPLTPLLAAASQVFGQSLFLLRLIPALCAAATVYITCLTVIEMGGGLFAQILAAICVTLAPVLCAFGMKQGPDMLEMPLWPLAALFVLRVSKGGDPRWWLGAGLAIGFAFESKYSVIFFAVALLVGLLISPQRLAMRSKWFWIAAAIAVVIGLPNVLWQAGYGFPMLELLHNGQVDKNIIMSPLQFGLSQFGVLNPVLGLFAIAGLVWLLIRPALRWIAYGYIVLIVMMILSKGKDYYPAPIYPLLFAAAGCALEMWTAQKRFFRPVVAAIATLFGLLTLPRVLPILPVNTYIAYARAVDLTPDTSEKNKIRQLPQDYADMFGWEEMTAAIAAVYNAIPQPARSHAVIITPNYGEASALNFFGAKYGLPFVRSAHNQYYLWGYGDADGSTIIRPNGDIKLWSPRCKSIRVGGTFTNSLVMDYEDHMPILVCTGLKIPMPELWKKIKLYI